MSRRLGMELRPRDWGEIGNAVFVHINHRDDGVAKLCGGRFWKGIEKGGSAD